MPKQRRLDAAAPWVEITTTAADWKAADPELLATMLGQLHLIRAFEERVLEIRQTISAVGMPHSPKPPTASDDPFAMSATASTALATTLSMAGKVAGTLGGCSRPSGVPGSRWMCDGPWRRSVAAGRIPATGPERTAASGARPGRQGARRRTA